MCMRTFTIYHHPTYGHTSVKVGFSWPAFFFVLPWLLTKKLWGPAGLLFVLSVIFNLSVDLLTHQTPLEFTVTKLLCMGSFGLIAAFIVGMKGNEWRGRYIERHGYRFLQTVHANNTSAALAQVTHTTQPPGQT